MYLYQENRRYFAQIAGGMEELGAEEIKSLGARSIAPTYRGLYFNADPDGVFRINYTSRLITRLLAPLTTFHCHNPDYLYRTALDIDWRDFMTSDQTFAVFANVSNSKMRHSKYAALRIKDAIVDQFRDRSGKRPSVDRRNADCWINLHIDNNQATISIDTSGGSLHRRGYRMDAGAAPMQETVAAAIIRLSEWKGKTPLYDPMCGSGTLLAEALMYAARIPAGYLRPRFGFESLPDFKQATWAKVKKAADAQIREIPADLIAGSDLDADAIQHAKANLNRLPHGKQVKLKQLDFNDIKNFSGTTLVMNPPYGVRMGNEAKLGELYTSIGDFLKQRCTGSTAFIYAGERAMLKKVGLRPSFKKPLVNGALDGRLAKYELY